VCQGFGASPKPSAGAKSRDCFAFPAAFFAAAS
jgi:hypothetical protein